MNILTDKRLLLCASMVQGRFAADIGTDHAYIPIWLMLNNKISTALACDIGKDSVCQGYCYGATNRQAIHTVRQVGSVAGSGNDQKPIKE